jgi:hypothetical protein
MLLAGPNIFMGYFACLVLDLQWTNGSGKIKVSSLAPKHIINPGELRFPIGLPVD